MNKQKKEYTKSNFKKSKKHVAEHESRKKNEKSEKIGILLWIVIVLFLILWIMDLFLGGTYGYDYYPFRNLYNR